MKESMQVPERDGRRTIYKFFTDGTQATQTGGQLGMEIETDFVQEDGVTPITEAMSGAILSAADVPWGPKLELGRQKIEIAVPPQRDSTQLFEMAEYGLDWLYTRARSVGAFPVQRPDFEYEGDLLWVQEERDALWVDLDGRTALEELCRCSSIQFTMDVNPEDAIQVINRLQTAQTRINYESNDARWRKYIDASVAGYRADRYRGPEQFESIDDYVDKLATQDIVMYRGEPARMSPAQTPDLDVNLFLRSVWWDYRLRRYDDNLAVEMRPFGRCADSQFPQVWNQVAQTIGVNI
jgi:hypothetical protein